MSNKITTVTFTGKSGKQYKFDTYTKDTSFRDVSAVYIFTKRVQKLDGSYFQKPLYIGESEKLGTRILNHEKWPYVDRLGCTHISIMQISGESARMDAESDLINGQNPPCNFQ